MSAHKLFSTGRFRPFLSCLLVSFLLLGFGQSRLAALQSQDHVLPAGISLPAKGGLYAVEAGPSGNALMQLHAAEITSNSHAGGNFARSMVYTGPRESVELDGLNAVTHLRGTGLVFLVRLSDDNADVMRGQLNLVRLRQTANRRVVSSYSQNIFGGQRKRQYDIVPITKTDVAEANWVKLTPVQPLPPGEYGIVIVPKDPNLFSGNVYDFDVDFNAAKPDPKPDAR